MRTPRKKTKSKMAKEIFDYESKTILMLWMDWKYGPKSRDGSVTTVLFIMMMQLSRPTQSSRSGGQRSEKKAMGT